MRPAPLDRHPSTLLVAGALCISWAPILVKALTITGLGTTAVAFWRCLVGTGILVVIAGARRSSLALPRRVLGLTALAALAFAFDLFAWHRSIVLVGAGMATILGNTQVFLTALLSRMLFGERLSRRFTVSAICALLGIVLLVGVGSEVRFTPDYLTGVGYGLATGLLYALFLVTIRASSRPPSTGSTLARIAWITLFSTLVLALLMPTESGSRLPSGAKAWALVFGLALVAQSVGWWFISRALARVRGAIAGLILLLQPVLATALGFALFGETLRPLQVLGALVTLASIYAGSQAPRRRAARGT